jgi:hypothetical protein
LTARSALKNSVAQTPSAKSKQEDVMENGRFATILVVVIILIGASTYYSLSQIHAIGARIDAVQVKAENAETAAAEAQAAAKEAKTAAAAAPKSGDIAQLAKQASDAAAAAAQSADQAKQAAASLAEADKGHATHHR